MVYALLLVMQALSIGMSGTLHMLVLVSSALMATEYLLATWYLVEGLLVCYIPPQVDAEHTALLVLTT